MKLQGIATIFAIIVIPMTLILSAYIGIQIDTAALQQSYDTKLLDATHDAVVAFQLNSIQNEYSTNADSLRRDIKASINAFFTSLATNLGTPGASPAYITQFIPAVVVTLYDGYYIYSPIETEYEENGVTKTKYEHTLKPYIHYSVRYKNATGKCDIVVNYSLDSYITVYGYMNGQYISRSGYLIADELTDVSDDGTSYKGIAITDKTAIQYYEAAKNFTNWIKTNSFGEYKIVDVVTPENAVDSNGDRYSEFENDSTKILNVTEKKNSDDINNDPEDPNSVFSAHKREFMKKSIQSNLNNAIYVYSKHTTLSYDFKMPVLPETDWDKVLSNVNMITFMQGLPVGTKMYNNYAIVTSTKNKQFVDKDLLYYIADGNYHKLDCPVLKQKDEAITGYRSIAYDAKKDKDGNYGYEHKELACYKCIVESHNEETTIDKDNLKQAFYNTLARERWNLNKPLVTEQTDEDNILDTVAPVIRDVLPTTHNVKITATDERTGIVGYAVTKQGIPTTFVRCKATKNLEIIYSGLTQNTEYYAWVIDAAGNRSVRHPFKTNAVPNGDITFALNPDKWTNQDVVVTASSKEAGLAYTVQVSTDENFTNIISGNSITVSSNRTIYARLVDNTNQFNGKTSVNVTNIDKEKPKITGTSMTTNSVTLTATDDASGIIGYAITTTEAQPSSFNDCENTKNLGITKNGLNQNTKYYTWVKDEAGNVTKGSFTTTPVPISEGNIIFSIDPSGWTNGDVKVTANSNVSGYIVQVSKSTTFPNTATEVTSVTVSSNQTVYARLVDSTNQTNGYASYKVTNIDKVLPQNATISLSSTNTDTMNSVKATVTMKDNESGVNIANSRWVYTTNPNAIGTADSSYPNVFRSNPQTINLSATTAGTYYLHVLTRDLAGNKKETISSAITVIEAEHNVKYYVDTNVVKDEKVRVGESCIPPKTFTPAKEGWTFVGWREDNTASSSVLGSKKMGNSDITLYAVFRQTITLINYNGTSTAVSESKYRYYNNGNTANPKFTVTAKAVSGWTFKGWATTNEANASITYSSISNREFSANTTVYGRYNQDITVSYNGNGATSGSTSAETKTRYWNGIKSSDPSFTLKANGFTKNKYTFLKWASGSANGTQYAPGASITPKANVTMYAVWVETAKKEWSTTSDSYNVAKHPLSVDCTNYNYVYIHYTYCVIDVAEWSIANFCRMGLRVGPNQSEILIDMRHRDGDWRGVWCEYKKEAPAWIKVNVANLSGEQELTYYLTEGSEAYEDSRIIWIDKVCKSVIELTDTELNNL